MKFLNSKTAFALAAMTLPAASAFAHNGDHGENIVATIMHWLSSPTHSLFAVVGGIALSAVIIKSIRKNKA